MSEEKEYIVTLHNHSDCEQFYDEMESNKSTEFIPGKEFNCIHRREISRNTHYFMTDEEAIQLGRDRRVLGIEEPPENRGLYPVEQFEWDSTTHFDRPWNYGSPSLSNSKVQWGILRSASGNSSPTAEYTTDVPMPFDKVDTGNQEGEGVDIVISDSTPDPLHPEFAVNRDGTGGSRLDYTHITTQAFTPSSSSNHGCHVAGIAAGNRQGWAPKADIYIVPSGSAYIDDVRAFHNTKVTGNPTILNMSWIYRGIRTYPIHTVNHRGTTYTSVYRTQALTLGCGTTSSYDWREVSPVVSLDADLQDCMNDGVICVAAADNYNHRYTRDTSDLDYNNYISDPSLGYFDSYSPFTSPLYYYNRGGSPNCAPGVISVGNCSFSTSIEFKAASSSKGPRVDIFAAGSYIQSSTNANFYYGTYGTEGILDNRTHSSLLNSGQMYLSGTSMAAPQVAGAIACLVGIYRDFTQDDVRNWLISQGSTNDQIYDSGSSDYDNQFNLMGAPNKFLYFNRERKGTGQVWPDADRRIKDVQSTSTRQVYPRMKRNYNVP